MTAPLEGIVLATLAEAIRLAQAPRGWAELPGLLDGLRRGSLPIAPVEALGGLVTLADRGAVEVVGLDAVSVRLRVVAAWPGLARCPVDVEADRRRAVGRWPA